MKKSTVHPSHHMHKSHHGHKARARVVREDPRLTRLRWFAALVLGLGLIMGAMAAQARPVPGSFSDLAEKLLPSVVNVSTEQTVASGIPNVPPGSPLEDFFKRFFDQEQFPEGRRRARGQGSGFIVDADKGLIVTNHHVIDGADKIKVTLHSGETVDAKLLGSDQLTDLAVLRVDTDEKLKDVKFGNSDNAKVGDWVLAIGNPFGLGGTVTAGIISARARPNVSGPYVDYLQTDASINRGNSGGPLFNLDGDVIGINSVIISPSGGSVGIGFAIPSSPAERIIAKLAKDGKITRGFLGVRISDLTEEVAKKLGLEEPEGALVGNLVADGPAGRAGIRPGDVILEFNGKKIEDSRDLTRTVGNTPVGDKSKVVVWRDGRKRTFTVTLVERDDEQLAQRSGDNGDAGKEKALSALGLKLSNVNEGLRQRFDLPGSARGVVITDVSQGSVAFRSGLREGQRIQKVNNEDVSNVDEVSAAVEKSVEDKEKVIFFHVIDNEGRVSFVTVPLEND